MDGQRLLNITLRVNAAFSMLSGLDLIIFDELIVDFVTGDNHVSIVPMGIMLVGFSLLVFAVSSMKTVNKHIVMMIIAADILWVLASVGFVVLHNGQLRVIGQVMILVVAAVIAGFAVFQSIGLKRHLAEQ